MSEPTKPMNDRTLEDIEQTIRCALPYFPESHRLCLDWLMHEVRRLRQQVAAYEARRKFFDDFNAATPKMPPEEMKEATEALRRELAKRAEKPLAWTKEPPTVSGGVGEWFWWRRERGLAEDVVRVLPARGADGALEVEVCGEADPWSMDQMPGEWAGPLQPPET